MNKGAQGMKTSNEIAFGQNQEADYTSFDAPPLDFSFKNIKHVQELLQVQPRQGEKKQVVSQQSRGKVREQKEQGQKQGGQQSQTRGEKRKNQAIRLLPQSNINSVVSTMINNSAMKNISLKAKEQLQKKKKKAIQIRLVCSSLMLGYNKLRELNGLNTVLGSIMNKITDLQWIDLSHNYLVTLDYNFSDFPILKTLYLHCNFIFDLTQLEKLKVVPQLKALNIHGNPFAAVPNFRILAISILPELKKLDSVLISKKERDNAIFIRSQTKKYPLPKSPAKPPMDKAEQEQNEKE